MEIFENLTKSKFFHILTKIQILRKFGPKFIENFDFSPNLTKFEKNFWIENYQNFRKVENFGKFGPKSKFRKFE